MITYTYPVESCSPGDKPAIIRKNGRIRPIQIEREPYEADVSADGYSFHLLFGSQCNGYFLCIPNWHTGCELAWFTDIFWNLESMSGNGSPLSYEHATAIAYALNELGQLIQG